MLNETDVGYYSNAFTLCSLWVFILTAIIDSIYPTVISSYKENKALFIKKNKQMYAIVFYLSTFVSVVFLVFGKLIVKIMYGEAFLPAAEILKYITWYTPFSYLGVARNAWIVCENKQKYLKYIYLAAAMNVVLNYFFIKHIGAVGAAIASVFTQVFTSIGLPLIIKDLRPNAILMIEAIFFRGLRK